MTDLTVGDGGQYATVAAAVVAWKPGDTIDLDSSNQTVTLGSGNFQLVVNGAGNTITMGRGNDSVTLNGSGNVVATGALQNVIRENGPGGNTIVTRAPGTGVNDIFGNAIQNGDILDLRATLAATSWDGDPSHLAAYFHITQVGTMARLNVSLVPGGHQYLVATFENAPPNLTVDQILAHAITGTADPAPVSDPPDIILGGTITQGGTVTQGDATAPPGAILTVGVGEEYATIAAAVAASHAGDTIRIDAGTYLTRDVMISHDLTLEGVGGEVDLIAALPGSTAKINVAKGVLIVGSSASAPNVTIDGLTFSGAKSGQFNGAGIRYQSGNLTLTNDTFHDNQDGILANPFVNGTGTITVDHSTFDHNGAGDGQSHNLYIGFVNSFTLTNSTSENANVGHEVKTRAENNIIENNTIVDGPTGTASYSIDLPNSGNSIVQGNTIEKGPNSKAGYVIHVGGPEMQNAGQVQIIDNTVTNDRPNSLLLWNQTDNPVIVQDNTLVGFGASPVHGMAQLTGNTSGSGLAMADAQTTFGTAAQTMDFSADPTNHTFTTTKPNTVVQGGAGHLTITPGKANNVFIGGSGGMDIVGNTAAQGVFTAAGSTNTISVGSGSFVFSSGAHDTISAGQKSRVTVLGNADVTMSTGNLNDLYVKGTATAHSRGGHDTYLVQPGGSLTVDGWAAGLNISEHDGVATFNISAPTATAVPMIGSIQGGAVSLGTTGGVSISQGASTPAVIDLQAGKFSITALAGTTVDAGAATVHVSMMAGAKLSFIGGSGSSTVSTGTGAAKIVAGSGSLAVTDQSKVGAEFDFNAAVGGGSIDIKGFSLARDKLVFRGFTGDPIANQAVVGGSMHLTLQNHTTVILEHLTHL